eukprot:4263903-Pyramimonas_sp.AAC.1
MCSLPPCDWLAGAGLHLLRQHEHGGGLFHGLGAVEVSGPGTGERGPGRHPVGGLLGYAPLPLPGVAGVALRCDGCGTRVCRVRGHPVIDRMKRCINRGGELNEQGVGRYAGHRPALIDSDWDTCAVCPEKDASGRCACPEGKVDPTDNGVMRSMQEHIGPLLQVLFTPSRPPSRPLRHRGHVKHAGAHQAPAA